MRFIEVMPERVRAVFAACTNVSLNDLGSLANNVLSLVPSTPTFAKVATSQPFRGRSATSPRRATQTPSTIDSFSLQIPIGIRPFYDSQKTTGVLNHLYYGKKARSYKA